MHERCKHLIRVLVATSLGVGMLLSVAGASFAALDPDPVEEPVAVCAATDLPPSGAFRESAYSVLTEADVQPDCYQLTVKEDQTTDETRTTPGLAKDLKITAVKDNDKHVGYRLTFGALDPKDYVVLAVAPGEPPTGLTVNQEPGQKSVVVRADANSRFKVILTPNPKKE